ncbi:hypothetical protein [Yimella lutea]|uniref:hypothetical protein n=1 Tax=Yimella lutea TaxID=587872 RepID=UPI001152E78C|nr:hypothetical protein [Yimella lutea]
MCATLIYKGLKQIVDSVATCSKGLVSPHVLAGGAGAGLTPERKFSPWFVSGVVLLIVGLSVFTRAVMVFFSNE